MKIFYVLSIVMVVSLFLSGCADDNFAGDAKGGKPGSPSTQCNDGKDNDGDGQCDYAGCQTGKGRNKINLPGDTDCDSALDDSEQTLPENFCEDSDGGENYFVKSSTILADGSGLNDDCRKDYVGGVLTNTGELLEAICIGTKTEYVMHDCDFGCFDGACLSEPTSYCGDGVVNAGEECDDDNTVSGDGCSEYCEAEYITCTDSDSGIGEFVFGNMERCYSTSTQPQSCIFEVDTCVGSSVRERFCAGVNTNYVDIECEFGCQHGVCL